MSEHNANVENKDFMKENLEKKIDMLDRLKYMSIPAVLMVGSYFAPEIKDKITSKYDRMSENQRYDYKVVALAGGTLLGAIITISSGYGLYKVYAAKKDVGSREEAHVNTVMAT